MDQDMKEIMLLAESMVLVLINGMMEVNTLVNGKKIKSQELEYMYGMMVENMKANTRMIKSMALVFIHGLMVVAMKVTGSKASNMV
jgi:NH3-dependent NAD+ synthetase